MIISQSDTTPEVRKATFNSPFLVKKVTINSYDSYNQPEPTEETFSRNDFPKMKSTRSHKLNIKNYNIGIMDLSQSSANIVKDMIRNGCNALNAYDTQKAVKAYGINALNTHGNVETISNNVYEV